MGLNQSQMSNVGINVLTTKRVEDIIRKSNLGMKLTRSESIWFQNQPQVRKAHLTFAMTDEELAEYIKCKKSVHYFAQKYCKIKREDGTIGAIKLRDYQKDIISLFDDNRFSILMASRQTGKCVNMRTEIFIKEGLDIKKLTLGELYYSLVKEIRNLTLIEKVKYKLYKILSNL